MNELMILVGLTTGLALYTMLFVMALGGDQRSTSTRGIDTPGGDPLPLATAVLGILWNLCTLMANVLPRVGLAGLAPLWSTVAFVALGFLPAVVVHSVVRGERTPRRGQVRKWVSLFGYAASAIAAVLQVAAFQSGQPAPSVPAMRLLTWAFVGLILPLAVLTRRQPGARRALWAAALAAFAVSALHLSRFHDPAHTWPVELVGHHASIPLAVAILYQDYPFALADLFLKRALLLIVFVATAFLALSNAGVPRDAAAFRFGLLTILWVLSALAYPLARRAIGWFVDSVVLARPDYRSLQATIVRRLQSHDSENALVDELSAIVRGAMSASSSEWRPIDRLLRHDEPVIDTSARPAIQLTIPTTEVPQYVISLGVLTGGRRLLSDDVSVLTSVAMAAARRIDAIRLTHERYEREIREQEVAKLATEAELRALRSQVNPHFLFNALTTIGHLIQSAPDRAVGTLLRLTSLLRAVLRSEGEFTTLGRELDLIEAYLDIEHARFEERLHVTIDVPLALRELRLPPLVVQPLVENAVKHGIAPLRAGGEVSIRAALEAVPSAGMQLCITVGDSGAGKTAGDIERGRAAGVGLRNVERRLTACYGTTAHLAIDSAPGRGTTVRLHLPADAAASAGRRRAG